MGQTTFPRHDIDRTKKDKGWHLQAAKTIWDAVSSQNATIFYGDRLRYQKRMGYVMGRPDVEHIKKRMMGKDEYEKGETILNVNFDDPRPIIPKMMNIAKSKILNRKYNFKCHPIDPLAKEEANEYYNEAKVKILQLQAVKDTNPELLKNPAFIREFGEPQDMEELEMSMEGGPKIKRAMDAQMAIRLIMYQNDYDFIREKVVEDLLYHGATGVSDSIDENANVKLDNIGYNTAIVSVCKRKDFKDKSWWGRIKEVPLSVLASKFDKEDMDAIVQTACKGQPGIEATEYNEEYDHYKVTVLEFELKSWDYTLFQQRVDSRGNLVIREEDKYSKERAQSGKKVRYNDEEIPQYKTTSTEVLYKGMWIIDTDFIYDFGLAKDPKRMKKNRAEVEMGAHFSAYTFHNMEASSFLDYCIGIQDEYTETVWKIQQFKSKWLPYIVEIDFDSLESVALGKNGKNLKPKELLSMFYKNFTIVTRKTDIAKVNPNHKSIDVRPTGMGAEFEVLVMELARLLNQMRDVLGLNEVTDGSSPNPNMLNYVASLGAEATNNALKTVMDAEKRLGVNLAHGIIRRAMTAVKKKRIEGLVPALGQETMSFFSFGPELSLHDWGILLQDLPTDQERQMLIQELNMKDANGQINPEDRVLIMQAEDLTQAQKILAYRQKKRQKEAQEYEMQKMKMNGDVQQQSSIVAEEAKQKTLMLEYKLKGDLEIKLKEMDVEIRKEEIEKDKFVAQQTNQTKIHIADSKPATPPARPAGGEKK